MAKTTRLYASLSEPRPVLGMDGRIFFACGLLFVAAILAIPFGGAVHYAPSAALGLACFGLSRFGVSLWNHSPYFVDEWLAHLRTPVVMGADEWDS